MRRPSIKAVLPAIVAVILITGDAHAQFTVTGKVADTPFPNYSPGPPSTTLSFLEVPGSSLQPFSVNYANEGDVELKFVWKAPAGQRFQVAAPTGYDTVNVSFEFGLESTSGSGILPNIGTMGFRKPNGELGETVNVKGRFAVDMSDDLNVKVTADFNPGETTTFESFEITFLIAAGYDKNFQDVNIETFRVSGRAEGPSGNEVTNPGNWLTLIQAPESRAEALARLSTLSRKAKKLKKKAKKAKKKGNAKKARKHKKKSRKAKKDASSIVIPAALPGFVPVSARAT